MLVVSGKVLVPPVFVPLFSCIWGVFALEIEYVKYIEYISKDFACFTTVMVLAT
jgi:hypothetical protein